MEKLSSNHSKVQFEGLVHLLRYIRYIKNLVLKYYAKIEDKHLSDLLINPSIKTDNQLVMLSDSRLQDFTDTGRSIGAYIVFDQGGHIDHCTHVPGPFY